MKPPFEALTLHSCSDQSSEVISPASRTGARLLIVDDEIAQRNMLAVMVEQAGMACQTVPDGWEALASLQTQAFDAVIADLNMPGYSGMELLTEVRRHYPQMVFLMATGVDDARMGVEAMRRGADDYLIKPLQIDVIMVSLDRAFREKNLEKEVEHYRVGLEEMVCKRTAQLQSAFVQVERSYADTLEALGAAIDMRDRQTAGHSRRVALCSIEILTRMHGTPRQLRSLAMGAWLHDIGKLAIPDAILLKPGPLTQEERRIIQGHVRTGYELVNRIPFLKEAAEIILTHHERWNGSGYPQGLKGSDIPLNSRIFAVADTLDAMTSDRPYHLALPFEAAREEIGRYAGIYFDSQVAAVFLSIPNQTWEAVREQTSAIQISAVLAGISAENSDGSSELAGPHE
jgi:response regulator RpfG family c-di-GMP phosphodiesterase